MTLKKSKTVSLDLPWPPTVGNYWIHYVARGRGGKSIVKMVVGKRGQQFRAQVAQAVRERWPKLKPTTRRVEVLIVATMPDRRKRDLDNLMKATLDALSHAGLWEDDSQIDELRISRGSVQKPGGLEVYVTAIGERADETKQAVPRNQTTTAKAAKADARDRCRAR